ncbi:MAG TPA: hypothetical protein VMR34_05720 [Candidatus Saccharimonadales bacterium]|nr:hypothetical protein [Candidatus Saccharimonadales bacterium]
MSNTPPTIRLSITSDVREVLNVAKKRYPALSDPEILKLGLSKIATERDGVPIFEKERDEIRRGAAYAVGQDYLRDQEEDVYTADMGKKVSFS